MIPQGFGKTCTCCGSSDINHLKVVRDVHQIPVNVLIAHFCDDCEDKRQEWLESVHDVYRGSEVRVNRGDGEKIEMVASFFDEEIIVNTKGYCIYRDHFVGMHQSTLF